MPTPIDLPASGVADANGNATIQLPVRAAYWSLIWATTETSGLPQIQLGVNGQAKLFAANPDSIAGPVMIPPQSQAFVMVLGATPGANVSVDFWGFQSAKQDGSDLAPMAGSPVTTGGLGGPQLQSRIQPSAIITQDAPGGTEIFNVNTTAFFQLADAVYITGGGPLAQTTEGPFYISGLTPQTVTTTPYAAGTDFPPGSVMVLVPTVTLPNNITIPVTEQNTPSAPWQSAIKYKQFAISMAATGIVHVIPSPGVGQATFIFAINAEVSAAGAFAGNWQDTIANLIHTATLQNGGPRMAWLGGIRTAGLDFNVTNAGSSFYEGSVAYSIGSSAL